MTANSMKASEQMTLLFKIAGALMIIAAISSAYLGFLHLRFYQRSLLSSCFVAVDNLNLYLGLLSSVAFGMGLFAAMLLIIKKQVVLAETLVAIVVAFGVATPLIYVFNSPIRSEPMLSVLSDSMRWLNGLFWGMPIIAFSTPALILVRLNRRKLQPVNMSWTMLPLMVAGALMTILAILSAYSGLVLLLDYQAGSATIYARAYLSALYIGLLNVLISVLSLFSGWLLLRRKQGGLATAPVVMVLVLGLIAPLLSWVGGYLNAALAFAPPTIALPITALLIMWLNRRNVIIETSANNAVEK